MLQEQISRRWKAWNRHQAQILMLFMLTVPVIIMPPRSDISCGFLRCDHDSCLGMYILAYSAHFVEESVQLSPFYASKRRHLHSSRNPLLFMCKGSQGDQVAVLCLLLTWISPWTCLKLLHWTNLWKSLNNVQHAQRIKSYLRWALTNLSESSRTEGEWTQVSRSRWTSHNTSGIASRVWLHNVFAWCKVLVACCRKVRTTEVLYDPGNCLSTFMCHVQFWGRSEIGSLSKIDQTTRTYISIWKRYRFWTCGVKRRAHTGEVKPARARIEEL